MDLKSGASIFFVVWFRVFLWLRGVFWLMFSFDGFDICWNGLASVGVVDEGFSVVVNPCGDLGFSRADLVLITSDSCYDRSLVEELCGDGSCVVLPASMDDVGLDCDDVEFLNGHTVVDIFGVEVESIPLYDKDGVECGGLGYRFMMRGKEFYVAGDTGLGEDLWDLEDKVDLSFLPLKGVNTGESFKTVIQTAVRIKPEVVIPYYYNEYTLHENDLRTVQAELEDRNIKCELVKPCSKGSEP